MKLDNQKALITFNKIEDKKLVINAKKITFRELKEFLEIQAMMGNIDKSTIGFKYLPEQSKLIVVYK